MPVFGFHIFFASADSIPKSILMIKIVSAKTTVALVFDYMRQDVKRNKLKKIHKKADAAGENMV
jgi:hypothetical protein